MFILNPYTAKPNTIIGGVGSVITTKSALATKLVVSESIIQNFKIVGSDVHCKITSNYVIPTDCFKNDTHILSYYDYDGKVIGGAQSYQFENSTIQKAEFPNLTTIYGGMFRGSAIQELKVLSATSILADGLRNTLFLNALTIGTLTSLGNYALENSIAKPDLSSVNTIGTDSINNTKYTTLNLPLITSVAGRSWAYMTLVTHAYFPNLTAITNSNTCFANWASAELISMKKLKTYGSAAGGSVNAMGFGNLKMGCKIEVNVFMATANAGAPHAAFLYAKNTRGATVEFYDDSGNYVSTL